MAIDHRARIAGIRRFDQLVAYLRDDMGWPIESADFEDLTFDYTPEELGIDAKNAAKIQEIKRLRPLAPGQPWGIFFVKFEPKRLPVVALRRILSQVALKKRASANKAEQQAWAADDLLFISNYGEDGERRIAFAHFAKPTDKSDLPTLKVLGWDNLDTPLHLDDVADKLVHHLSWPEDASDEKRWRARWRGAFVLRHGEVVSTSRELSVRLAELARTIRDRIKTAIAIETEKGPLTTLMKGFQATLVHDLTTEGFADMYAQTIAYGLLSSRIADPQKKTADDFAAHMRTNPFLRELMETFLKVGGRKGKRGGPGIDFDELGVSEVIELLDNANMEAVIRDFGDRNPQEDPVIHFYELFLKEYDAKKRMQRGVFYTPRPVVSFIVRSIDELLRTQFGLEDGLADTTTWGEMVKRHEYMKIPEGASPQEDFVQILDPATGTGTFLVEVIELIHETLLKKWRNQGKSQRNITQLWNNYVSKHLLKRLHGYELLMAPYAIAHLKVGLKLHETGYKFDSDERTRLFLTNALEPALNFSSTFNFAIPALAQEAEAVNTVKDHRRFTVVIGNPPYSGFSTNMNDWIDGLLHGKIGNAKAGSSYYEVAGAPLAERKVWLQDDYVKFIRLSHYILETTGVGVSGFITNSSFLDGPTYRGMRYALTSSFSGVFICDLHGSIKRYKDASSFSEDENVFDIQQGVAVSILVRNSGVGNSAVIHTEIRGNRQSKYDRLLSGAPAKKTGLKVKAPWYLFIPSSAGGEQEYADYLSIKDLFSVKSTAVQTSRDAFVVGFDSKEVEDRVSILESAVSDQRLRDEFGLRDGRNWSLMLARKDIRSAANWQQSIRPYLYRAFDWRHLIYRDSLVNWPRHDVMDHLVFSPDNIALLVPRQLAGEGFRHVFCSRLLCDMCVVSTATKEAVQVHPLFLDSGERTGEFVFGRDSRNNFSSLLRNQLGQRGIKCRSREEAKLVFGYIYAILYSEEYRNRYAEFLRIDFPRIPFTEKLELFHRIALLGWDLISFHLLEASALNSGRGLYVGHDAAVIERVEWADEVVWIDQRRTCGFRGVTEDAWGFHIGGYQVCEKWLKDRRGRILSQDDIAQYQKIVVAISETIRLMKEIDEVIEQHGGWPGAFQTKDGAPKQAKVIPFRPVQPTPKERYRTCVPMMPLKAAAGAFSAAQHIEDNSYDWVEVDTSHRLREGMFVSQVVGRSMEPMIPDGSYCLFRAPVDGSRQGKTVLVQLRDVADPETSQRFTVKRYKSDKAKDGDSWRHERITLEPLNPDFDPIVLTDAEEGTVQVIAELVEVLPGSSD